MKALDILDNKGNVFIVLKNEEKVNIYYIGGNNYLVETNNNGKIETAYKLRYPLISMLKSLEIKHCE